jgi:putative aldouronate transport system substrate-binding protein
VQIQHQAEVDMLAFGVADPSLGLYSQTDSTRGTAIMQTVTDGFTDIVAGRRPMSDYDSIVRSWRSSGGDQIRKEYQQAWQSSHKA